MVIKTLKAQERRVDKLINEQELWLEEHGYNPIAGKLHLDTLDLRNKIKEQELMRALANSQVLGGKG